MTFAECYGKPIPELVHIFHQTQYCTNTETYMMTDCLLKIFDAQRVYPNDIEAMREAKADAIVVNGLHCITGKGDISREYWQSILDLGIKVVPMPFGFWYHGGYDVLPPNARYILQQISERNEIGVRGPYAADILTKAGIKNVRVIGDVSLMYPMNRNLKVREITAAPRSINFDFTNFYPFEFHEQQFFMKYIFPIYHYMVDVWEKGGYHIDYTSMQCPMENLINHTDLEKYERSKRFLLECGRFFFRAADWIRALAGNDFSFGTRFHGCIASVIAGTPACVFALDKRMEELLTASHIPYYLPEEFDSGKPIEYYIEKCDYSDFNKNYPAWYDNFVTYCEKNGALLKKDTREAEA